jgi:hypothetical protein
MKSQKMTFQEAYDFIKSKRGCLNPNPGFQTQLMIYEHFNCAESLKWEPLFKRNIYDFKPGQKIKISIQKVTFFFYFIIISIRLHPSSKPPS